MSNEHLINTRRLADCKAELSLLAGIPTIRILLYVDHPDIITKGTQSTGLSTMLEHLSVYSPAFANISVDWLSRYSISGLNNADHKLNAELLKEYDQIWFFGIHQMNADNSAPRFLFGGQENELEKEEVDALTEWMQIGSMKKQKGGGVLMTGDHANRRPKGGLSAPNSPCPDNSEKEEFLGMGRAIGHCVPRAGLLRKWEGPPTTNVNYSFNTQAFVPGMDLDDTRLQLDSNPMQLLLKTFDAKGHPIPGGSPHPLFLYRGGKFIRVFPDHLHEGAVILPDKLDNNVWPGSGSLRPEPQVVAQGIDNRNGRLLNILAAYNGDCVGVGRVVADSTWHHYLNENLQGLASPATEGSVADQIGQFYGNLAMWLTPLNRRREMAYVMLDWLAHHLFVQEELRAPTTDESVEVDQVIGIGRAAYSLLSRVASPCEIHELLQTFLPEKYCGQFETVYFPERGFSLTALPSTEVILGFIIDSYQQRSLVAEGKESLLNPNELTEIIGNGFKRAFQGHARKFRQVAQETDALLGINQT